MAPNASVLFHPRKPPPNRRNPPPNANGSASQGTSAGSAGNTPTASPATPQRPRPKVPRPKPKTDDDAARPPPPEGPFVEYKLMSSALNGWKYDVMKFESRKPVDIMTWARPVKLNRKDTRRDDGSDGAAGPSAPRAVGPMLGPDGKPVIGMDGKMVMVDAEGKPIRPGDTVGPADPKGKEKAAAAKKKFQKKTKQVFLVPESVRQLRREERYQWVMEDSAGRETWVATMEEVSKAETQAMFMPSNAEEFKFVPAHRWYKFQKKLNHHVPNLQEAEELMKQIQKNKDPERWLLRKRNGQGPSEATAAMFKSEREGSAVPSGSLVYNASQSFGPGGRKLKAVDSGAELFGDDDDEEGGDGKRKMKREYGQEGDLDELDFEEDFQDDDEKAEPDVDDEEAKELEERLKREYKTANKTREGYIDESEEEEDEPQLTGAGKDMRKLMKKHEKNGAYDDSDDERNPYASSEEEEPEEEPPQVPQGPAIIPPEPRPAGSRSTSQAPSKASPPATSPKPANFGQQGANVKAENGSRATSPVAMPGHGGHSIVAKRATSPKVPKLKTNGTSRAGSPLAPNSPTSPVGSPPAAASPTLGSSSSQPTAAGVSAGKPSNKRKAEEGVSSKPKKRKPHPVGGELEDKMVIEWLKQTPNATTRDCIHYFTPYLTTEEKKSNFTKLVKEVATLKNGVLVLRNAYRGASSAPSPAANGTA